jgi:predicted DNA-binding transcriptional regulator YafY
MMANNRHFQMVYLLMDKGNMTAPALAEYFEVSVRTIYRDVDILSAAGFPIYAEQGKGGGIFLQENYVLNKSLITEQEQNQILLALQGLNIFDEENTTALLSKLSSIFHKQNTNWIEVDFSDWIKDAKHENTFDKLKSAIFKRKLVTFNYSSGKGETVNRLVEPLKLVFKNKDWFLYGYCCLREDYRLFKLARIKGIEITHNSFSRETPPRIFGEAEQYHGEFITVTLLFENEMAFRVYDNFDSVTENEDGRLLVNVSLPHNEWMYIFILSFGDKTEVLTPLDVRNNIIARISNMKKKYEKEI